MKKFKIFNRMFAITASCIMAFSLISFSNAVAQVEPDIEDVLENLNNEFSTINSIIPNRYDFSNGETGYYIYSGGSYMYYYGNFIGTNIGSYVDYSNNLINTSGYFGGEGKYFTRKYEGLFVLAANLENVSNFAISGDLESYESNVDGTMLTSGLYKGFVKRVYGSPYGGPSVNHLMIVKNDPNVQQTYSTSYYSDYHEISNLNNTSRIYYLLYAGANGYYIDNEATQQIMDAFVALLITDTIAPNPVNNLFVDNILNSSALLSWTAPSDDSLTEPVSAYDVRLSTSPINSQNYFSAPIYQQSVTPGVPGSSDSLILTGLTGQTQYWAGIRAMDEGENYSSPVITVFTTGADPAISVSVNSLEFEVAIGETISESFNISNSATQASPLSYSIVADNTPVNDIMSYVQNSNGTISMVNLLTKEVEDYNMGVPISDINYSKAADDLLITSTDYDMFYVLSTINNTIRFEYSLSNLFKICVPKYQEKVYAVYYSNQLKLMKFDAKTFEIESTVALDFGYQPDWADISPDGSKLYLSYYYDLIVMDATSGEILNFFDLDYYVGDFIISDDGHYAYSNYSYYVSKIDLQTGALIRKNLDIEITALALSSDGQTLFAGFYYSTMVAIVPTQTMIQSGTINKNTDYTADLHVSADGRKLYCLNRYSPNLTICDIQEQKPVESFSVGSYPYMFAFPGGYDDYLQVSPESGNLSSGQNQDIAISISTDLMIPGIYHSDIKIQSNDPANSLVTIPVTLHAKDITGPDFNIVFFQNHYLTTNLQVLAFMHEPLTEMPTLTANSIVLDLEMLDSLNNISNAGYKLTTTENITFTISGQDSVGNASTFERVLSSTQVYKNAEIKATYPANEVVLELQPETTSTDVFITIWKEWVAKENSWVYHIGPELLTLTKSAILSLSFDKEPNLNADPSHYSIYRKEPNAESWIKISSKINMGDKSVKAEIQDLGIYKIGYDENTFSPDEIQGIDYTEEIMVTPNPFCDETTIFYENPCDGEVLISIFDNTGKKVIEPVNGFREKGSQSIVLQGVDMKSGVYTCKIKTTKGLLTKKIIRID